VVLDFSGRQIVVTGGSRGLGRAIAAAFLRGGGAVSICARDAAMLANAHEELSGLGKTHSAVCNLAEPAEIISYIEAAARALGGIDVLVNNATAYGRADDERGWNNAFNVDLMSIVRTCWAALPWLQMAKPEGAIVNIGSIAGTRPSVKAPAYGAIKAAITHYTASQAAVLAKCGVRVNAIAPGAVTAPGHYWEQRCDDDDPAYREICQQIPAGRPADAWIGLFVPDVDCGRHGRGREALRGTIEPELRRFYRSVHFIGGHHIEFDDQNHAHGHGHVYCRAEHEDCSKWIVMAICYFDQYARHDGAWYFVRRREQHWCAVDALDRPGVPFQRWPGHGTPPKLPAAFPTWATFWQRSDPPDIARLTQEAT